MTKAKLAKDAPFTYQLTEWLDLDDLSQPLQFLINNSYPYELRECRGKMAIFTMGTYIKTLIQYNEKKGS